MTVSSSLNRKAYTGDGVTTSFSTSPVVFYDSDELDVYVVTTATGASTTLTENTHYTVSGGAGSTGTVNLAGGSSPYGAPSASQTLVIVRTLDLVQEFDPQNNDGSDADNIERAFDKLTMMAQQNAAGLARSLRLADSDVTGASLTVPTPSASKLIGWDSAGTALENKAAADVDLTTVTAFIQTLLDDTSAATARTTLDAMQDVFTTRGDLVRAGASGVAERVALGAAGTVLTSDGTDAVWGAGLPVGVTLPYAGTAAPSGYLLCYGQAVSRTTYADLFAVVSTTYGSGDGSTTFNVPDLRGRSVFGKDDMGGSAASRLTNGNSGITGTTLGAAGGDERLYQHLHAAGTLATASGGAHTHTVNTTSGAGVAGSNNVLQEVIDAPTGTAPTNSDGAHTHTMSGSTANTGGNTTSQNIPPALVLNWIIKT